MEIDINNLEQLLKEKKYDEARTVIESAVSAKFSGAEKGAALAGLASVYLDISNAINASYKASLEEAVEGMKSLNAAEKSVGEKVRLAEVRDTLSS